MKFNKVCFALLMLLAIASQSCTDMNDLTDKYLDCLLYTSDAADD